MNRLLLLFFAISAGAIGFSQLQRTDKAKMFHTFAVALERFWAIATLNGAVKFCVCAMQFRWHGNPGHGRRERAGMDVGNESDADIQETLMALRAKVSNQKKRLHVARQHADISPALLQLLEQDFSKGDAAAWAELMQQLGVGWDSSPDYVLVSKRVVKQLQFNRLDAADRPSDLACDVFALSPGEQSAIRSALEQARQTTWWTVVRTEPSGDIAAQYTVRPPSPLVQASVSNQFATSLTSAVGTERAALLLPGVPGAWSELKSHLWPAQTQKMTVRQIVSNGEPDLIYEMAEGGNVVFTEPVRYAHSPSSWFLTLFPRGWQTLAQREHFELPPSFAGKP
jgi:hypothetical protein